MGQYSNGTHQGNCTALSAMEADIQIFTMINKYK